MRLKAKLLNIQAGGRRTILDDKTASLLCVHSSDKVKIKFKKADLIAIVNIANDFTG